MNTTREHQSLCPAPASPLDTLPAHDGLGGRRERLARLGIVETSMGYVDGMSVYEYVGSSPASKLDPTGMLAEDPIRYRELTWNDFTDRQIESSEHAYTGTRIYWTPRAGIKYLYENTDSDGRCRATARLDPTFDVYAVFDRGASWYNRQVVEALAPDARELLLRHENMHFRISENIANHAGAEIESLRGTGIGANPRLASIEAKKDLDAKVNSVLTDIGRRQQLGHSLYDLLTTHGQNVDIDTIIQRVTRPAPNSGEEKP